MKKLLVMATAVVLLMACQTKKDMLLAHTWELFNAKEIGSDMVVRFNADGSFYYEENGTPKGEELLNRWQLAGDQLTLHWSGIYLEKANTLRVYNIKPGKLILINEHSDVLPRPMLYFVQSGSPALKMKM